MSPVRPPEIAELRTFCLAADLGSLGRAAMRLNLSQPALSKRLQALEALAGCRLLERSPRGVSLTDAGRRLYEPAHRALEGIVAVEQVLDGLAHTAGPVVLAASHSAAEAFVGGWLALRDRGLAPVELLTANSQVVRRLVAEGRAELGVAAGRPGHAPTPGVRDERLRPDEIVCGVPKTHPWARLPSVSTDELCRTPVVVRDPGSNARWTVQAELRRRGLPEPPLLAQASTPAAARREALRLGAPVLLSRYVLGPDPDFEIVPVRGLHFERTFELVLPAGAEPTPDVRRVADELRGLAVS